MDRNELRKLAEHREGVKLADLLPEVNAEIEGMNKTVRNQAYAAIRDGQLTGDLAIQLWMQMFSHDRLLTRLTGKTTSKPQS